MANIDSVKNYLQIHKRLDLETVPHFRAIDELRLLNNCIKHETYSTVSRQLANRFPRWKEGDNLESLDKAYKRLSPKIPAYIFRLAERMRLKYK